MDLTTPSAPATPAPAATQSADKTVTVIRPTRLAALPIPDQAQLLVVDAWPPHC